MYYIDIVQSSTLFCVFFRTEQQICRHFFKLLLLKRFISHVLKYDRSYIEISFNEKKSEKLVPMSLFISINRKLIHKTLHLHLQ